MNKKILMLIVVLLMIQYSGCIELTNNEQYSERTVIKVAFKDNESISPVGFNSYNFLTLLPNIYDGLVEFDETFQLKPVLATSWSNPDKVTWRFHLQENVTFHNGQKFSSEDVKNSLLYYSGLSSIIANVSIIDTFTIDIITKEPEPTFLQKIAFSFFIYPHNYSHIENDFWRIGTGPYQLSEVNEGNYTKLTLFDDYWGEKPHFDTVYYYVIPDATDRLEKLIDGEFDFIDYDIDENINNISLIPTIQSIKYSPLSTYIIGFDMRNSSYMFPEGNNPTANRSVRKAMYHAINVTELIEGPFQGFAYPSSQLLTPYHFGYNPEIQRLEYDPILARKLLNASGYEQGFDIELDAITVGFEYNRIHAELIKKQLSEIQVNVTINYLSMDEFNYKVIYQKNTSLWLIGWTIGSIDGGALYPYYLMNDEEYIGYYNSGHYSNDQVNQLGYDADNEININKRNQLIQEGFRIAHEDDIFLIPLLTQELIMLAQHDLSLIPRADSKLKIEDISIE